MNRADRTAEAKSLLSQSTTPHERRIVAVMFEEVAASMANASGGTAQFQGLPDTYVRGFVDGLTTAREVLTELAQEMRQL